MTTWSKQQESIFGWFKEGAGNLVVRARAGTGKTTTIVEAIRHAPEPSILLAAFNKRIATELQRRVTKPGAECKTLHSVGFGFIRQYWSNVSIDQDRGRRLAQLAAGDQAPDEMLALVAKVASLGKNISPLATPEELAGIAIDFDRCPDEKWEEEGWTTEMVARHAHRAMRLALERDEDGATIDFDDMVYLPVANAWARPRYDLVCIDEAQDMNASQLMLAMAVARGRVVVVGDDRQAIYGFRGADSNAIDNLKGNLKAAELGLTVTYRCAKTIVDHARTLVPDFTAHDTNQVGEIVSLNDEAVVLDTCAAGDFILSRKNAPLAPLCLKLLRAGKRARIEGKDIGATLTRIVKERRAKTLQAFEEKMSKWRDRQAQKAKTLGGGEAKVQARVDLINDQFEMIMALCDGVATVPELLNRISQLFSDSPEGGEKAAVVLSSIHKAKGLEADRVYVLTNTLYPGGDRSKVEEQNLEYVAVTRAKRTLVWAAI